MVALLLFPVLLVNKHTSSVYRYEYKLKLSQKTMQENLPIYRNMHRMAGEVFHQMTKLYLLQICI